MTDSIRLPTFVVLAICCLAGAVSAATPPEPNAEVCYEKISCQKAFEAKPELENVMIDPDPLGGGPLQIAKDMKCRPEPSRFARGAKTLKGWFPSTAQCGRVWVLKKGTAGPGISWARTSTSCGASEVDIEKKKTCVAPE